MKSSENHSFSDDFRRKEINESAKIRLIFEAKFGDDLLQRLLTRISITHVKMENEESRKKFAIHFLVNKMRINFWGN